MNQLGKERRSSLARHTERNTQSTRPTQKVHTDTKIIKDEASKIQNPYIHPQWDIKRNEQKHKHSYSQKHIETETHTHTDTESQMLIHSWTHINSLEQTSNRTSLHSYCFVVISLLCMSVRLRTVTDCCQNDVSFYACLWVIALGNMHIWRPHKTPKSVQKSCKSAIP